MAPEGKVKALVKKGLAALPRRYHFMPVQNGMGAPGLDFFCCIAGYFVAIETKAPGKNPTPRQEQTIAEIEAADGLVFVIRTKEDVETMIARLILLAEYGGRDPYTGSCVCP